MKAASLAQIKQELRSLDQETLVQLCLRLGRFKSDNKELLTYLLFEQVDERGYVALIKEDLDEQFGDLNTGHIYYFKKGLRKILRVLNKNIRYSGLKQTEVELRIYFCQKLRSCPVAFYKYSSLKNLYDREITKIKKALTKLHEDLQADYEEELKPLL